MKTTSFRETFAKLPSEAQAEALALADELRLEKSLSERFAELEVEILSATEVYLNKNLEKFGYSEPFNGDLTSCRICMIGDGEIVIHYPHDSDVDCRISLSELEK